MNSMFDIFLRDAPVLVSAALDAAGFMGDVDAMTCRNNGDEYTIAVRHRGDWYLEKAVCRKPKQVEDELPKMRAAIDEIAEGVVRQIAAVN